MPNLFPTINLPTLMAPRVKPAEKVYKLSPSFDFESGEFLFTPDGKMKISSGKESFCAWVIKNVMTERGTRMAYSKKIGAEFEAAMKKPELGAIKSSLIRTITETILVHPAAEYVKDFQFKSEGDSLYVTFTVKGRPWQEENLTVKVGVANGFS